MNNLTLRQLRAFQAVALTRSFTGAAEALHLTPAALSGLVKELETQLGVRLFDRNTRNVVLSGVGEEFFPLTERVLQDLDDAVLSVMNLKEKRRGIVRIAAPEVMSCTLIPSAMATFREQYPQVELRFLDVPIEDVITRTVRGEVDVGIAPGLVAAPGIERKPFMRAPLMVAMRTDDRLASRRHLTWQDLEQRQFVTFFRSFNEWAPAQRAADREGMFPRDVTFVRRINTALAMVQGRFGITLCPVYAGELASAFGLRLVRLTEPEIDREYALLTRAGHSLTPPVDAFCAFFLDFAPRWAKQQRRPT
jgi:DNA-binding transcriptional LysR family regulator